MLFSFACYEACFQTALVLVFVILLVHIRYRKNANKKKDKEKDNKELRKFILKWLGITLGILALEYLVNRFNYFLIGKIFEINNINIKNESSYENTIEVLNELGFTEFLVYLGDRIKSTLEYSNLMAFEIIGTSIVGIILSIYDSVKNKHKHLWWIIILMLISNILFFLYLRVILFRTYFSMCVTFGIMLLYINEVITERLNEKAVERILAIFVGFIILLNTKDVNQLFCKDYIGYERDKNYYQSIALEINKLDYEKPLLFVKGERQEYNIVLNNYPDVRRNLNELYFGSFGKKNSEEFLKIFNSLGYTYNVVTDEKYE